MDHWRTFIFCLFLSGAVCVVHPDCHVNKYIHHVQACLNKAYPVGSRLSLPAGANVAFFQKLCNTRGESNSYLAISSCLQEIQCPEIDAKYVTTINVTQIEHLWRTLCQNSEAVTSQFECFRERKQALGKCKHNMVTGIRNEMRLIQERGEHLTFQRRFHLACRYTHENVKCDEKALTAHCDDSPTDLVTNYNDYVNLWACAGRDFTPRTQPDSAFTTLGRLPTQLTRKPGMSGFLFGYYMFDGDEPLCVSDAMSQIDQCFIDHDYMYTSIQDNHPIALLALGHTIHFQKLCSSRLSLVFSTVSNCITEKYNACPQLKNIYDLSNILEELDMLCAKIADIEDEYSQCVGGWKHRVQNCLLHLPTAHQSSEDICWVNKELNECFGLVLEKDCSPYLASLLTSFHKARQPKHCSVRRSSVSYTPTNTSTSNMLIASLLMLTYTTVFHFLFKYILL